MLKLRTKLGITTDDLLPASAAFESEQESQPQGQRRANQRHGAPSGQDEANVDDGSGRARAITANSGRCETATPATPDIGRWKKEADDMLSLLGTNADKCVHDYPMTELRRKVLPPSVFVDIAFLGIEGPCERRATGAFFVCRQGTLSHRAWGGELSNISAGLNFHV